MKLRSSKVRFNNQTDYILDTIKDHFSISVQLYYVQDDPNWVSYANSCCDLVEKLKELDSYNEDIKPELVNIIYAVSQDKRYSIWVV